MPVVNLLKYIVFAYFEIMFFSSEVEDYLNSFNSVCVRLIV